MQMYDNFLNVVKTIYYIIYARLSKEEQGKSKDEQSRSIKNQIDMCQKFIEEERKSYPYCQFKEVAILKDDGISGTTFDREDFNKLVTLIEDNQANMVITKDLSRLGRDHIKTDDYIEKWFPEHNVRYVSIMENVDTYTDCVSNEIAPIINWSNDNFARQTSKKIKKTFKSYREEGKWTGGEPPLGYQIDANNKYHLIIEEKGKEIVQMIFKMFLENNSIDNIINIFMKEKVPIPSVIKGHKRKLNQNLIDIWSFDTIKSILQNEMYLGHMVQGKTTRLNHKSKKIIYLPKDKWSIVKNTHEPIIDKQTFESVQLLFKVNKNKSKKSYDYLLKGLLKCKECNHSIGIQHYKKRKNNYTVCNYYRKYGSKKNVCTAHRFIYEDLEAIVLKNIKEHFQNIDKSYIINKLKNLKQNNQEEIKLKLNIKKSIQEIEKLKRQIDNIYNDKLEGIIDKEQYQRIVKSKLESLEYEKRKLKRIKKALDIVKNNKIKDKDYIKIINDFLDLKILNHLIIGKLIDCIYLDKDGFIDIYYKFSKPC